jgi:hypothetical protein
LNLFSLCCGTSRKFPKTDFSDSLNRTVYAPQSYFYLSDISSNPLLTYDTVISFNSSFIFIPISFAKI